MLKAIKRRRVGPAPEVVSLENISIFMISRLSLHYRNAI